MPDEGRTRASRAARVNFLNNLTALRRTQPDVCALVGDENPEDSRVEFAYGRDGALTARREGRWVGDCSVPRAAAGELFKTLSPRGKVVCLVGPSQAAQVHIVLDRAAPTGAVICLVPNVMALRHVLHCGDFSCELATNRLWFAAGDQWGGMLEGLFRRYPGLPIPSQFVRTTVTADATGGSLIEATQGIFSAEAARRQALANTRHGTWRARTAGAPPRIGVVAPSQFRLWDGASTILRDCVTGAFEGVRVHDTDDPLSASPLGLALAAEEMDVLFLANRTRGDLGGLIPEQTRCVTWWTTSLAPMASTHVNDVLVVADGAWADMVVKSGWDARQVKVAHWPTLDHQAPAATDAPLVMIADTSPIETEPAMELSSHRLLWQAIAAELAKDPFALGDDPAKYLKQRRARMNIKEEGFDTARFFNGVILLAYQQGMARMLIAACLPLQLYGEGWDRIADFASHAKGTVRSREEMVKAAEGACGLVHAWPGLGAHEIDSLGRPVLRRPGRRREAFVREARAMTTSAVPPPHPTQPLTAHGLRAIVASIQ